MSDEEWAVREYARQRMVHEDGQIGRLLPLLDEWRSAKRHEWDSPEHARRYEAARILALEALDKLRAFMEDKP